MFEPVSTAPLPALDGQSAPVEFYDHACATICTHREGK